MTTFLGPVGSLIPVKCASQLTSSGGRSVSFQDTLGKRKAFLGKVKARQWSVDIGLAAPGELSGLRWLAENVNTPMVWYSPDAVVGNILMPEAAAFSPGSHSGLEGPLVEVAPDTWVKSAMPDGGSAVSGPVRGGSLDSVPVVAGVPVTVSAWLRGATVLDGQVIAVNWRDVSGVSLSSESVTVGASTSVLTRRSFTRVPPAGAVQVTLQFFAHQVAGPAVTLSDRLLPYSVGKGAKRVVAHNLSDAIIRATENQQLESLSFTVSEVG